MSIPYGSNFDGTIGFTKDGAAMALAANTELTTTVPGAATTKYQALFAYPANAAVWVNVNETATAPAAGTIGATRSELRPDRRYVHGGDVLHFITGDTTAICGVSYRTVSG